MAQGMKFSLGKPKLLIMLMTSTIITVAEVSAFFYVKDLGYYRESKCIGDKNHTLKGGYLYVNIISSYFYCGACHGGNLQAAEITKNNRNAYYRNRIGAIRFKSSRFLYIGDFSGLEKNGVNNYFVKGRIIP